MIPILESIISGSESNLHPKILYDPKVNPLALSKWSDLYADPVLFRNGHSQIKAYLKEINGLAGAEESGHYYHQLPYRNLLVYGENSLYTLLLFLQSVKTNGHIIEKVREMQDQIYTSGEFSYEFITDEIRDSALAALIDLFKYEKASLFTKSESGIELEGTVAYKDVLIENGEVTLGKEWFSAYLRTATNEKGVVRSYISICNAEYGEKTRKQLVKILKEEFNGNEIE
jgi:phosphomannomutase